MSRIKLRAAPKRRLNLELTAATQERIDRLVQATDADTMTEVVRRAVTLYDVVVAAQLSDCEIMVKGKAGSMYRLLVL